MAKTADLLHRAHVALALAFVEISHRSGAGTSAVDGHVAMYSTGHPEADFYNGALRLDPGVDGVDLIRAADAFFAHRVSGYTLWVLLGRDDDMARAARGSGLRAGTEMPEMICERVPTPIAPPDGVQLTVVSANDPVHDSNTVMAHAFSTIGVPPDAWGVVWPDGHSLADAHIATVVAYESGVPVAGAMVVVVDGAGEVLNIGTVPWRRRRGLGRLVAHRVTCLAFEIGAEFASLQATPLGASVYQSLGYATVGYYRCYLRRWARPATPLATNR